MQWWEAALVAVAGSGAGAINAVVGSGTLITFPTLLALGFPPVVANVSNNIGLVAGGVTGTWGYRRELSGRRAVLTRLMPCSALGAITGAVLLLVLPPGAFEAIVPVLIAVSVLLVLAQPRLAARRSRRSTDPGSPSAADSSVSVADSSAPVVVPASGGVTGSRLSLVLLGGIFAAGVYGGYFGAAQGVLLLGLLTWLHTDSLQIANGVKNLLGSLVNGVAALTFLVIAPDEVDWLVVLLIAGGSAIGAVVGARVGRVLPAPVLRGFIVVVGVVAIVRLVLT